MDVMDTIRVCIRVRPLNKREQTLGHLTCWNRIENTLVNCDTKTQFAFDSVFDQLNENGIYNRVKDLIHSVMDGFNATIIAYGQTSSGKTHTMIGNEVERGIIPNAIQDIFKIITANSEREYLLRVCYLEIYNEVINDLLQPGNVGLKIHETPNRDVFVGNITEVVVLEQDQVLQLMKKGNTVGETNVNERSSRSHSIFRIVVESRLRNTDSLESIRVATLNLVDLAGSERVGYTCAKGARLKEAGNINKSLLALGTVIGKLANSQESKRHIPYRDSKLTRILQPALGGNSKTAIICTVTPSNQYSEETLSTLKFASRAMTIKTRPELNEIVSEDVLIKKYKIEIDNLRKELDTMKTGDPQKNDNHSTETLFEMNLQNINMILDSSHLCREVTARRKTWHPITFTDEATPARKNLTPDTYQSGVIPSDAYLPTRNSFSSMEYQDDSDTDINQESNIPDDLPESGLSIQTLTHSGQNSHYLDIVSFYNSSIQQLLAKNELLEEYYLEREKNMCQKLTKSNSIIKQLETALITQMTNATFLAVEKDNLEDSLLKLRNCADSAITDLNNHKRDLGLVRSELIDLNCSSLVNGVLDSLKIETQEEIQRTSKRASTIGTQTPRNYTIDAYIQTNTILDYATARTRVKQDKSERVPCSYCDKTYIDQNRLNRHMREKHPHIFQENHQENVDLYEDHDTITPALDQENTVEKRKDISLENVVPKKRKLKGLKGQVSGTPLQTAPRNIKYEGW